MIARKEPTAVAVAARTPVELDDSFMETCLYALTPAQ